MTKEERLRLMPHVIESQITQIEQVKGKATKAHRALMDDFNKQIKNLKRELERLEG
jgi:hypothetical protein